MTYKGMMFSEVPNLVSVFGYTNASWTLKCDLTCEYVCRLLNYMDARGYTMCRPRRDPDVGEAPWLNLTSGYIKRVEHMLPRAGTKAPWKLYQNYALDMLTLRFGKVDDGTMEFSAPDRAATSIRGGAPGGGLMTYYVARTIPIGGAPARRGCSGPASPRAGECCRRGRPASPHRRRRERIWALARGQHRRGHDQQEVAAVAQMGDQLGGARGEEDLLRIRARPRGASSRAGISSLSPASG